MTITGPGVDGLIVELPDRYQCCGPHGVIRVVGGQNTVRCATCDAYTGWNAPKTTTGERARSVSTVRSGIKPSTRERVLERARGRCELCGLDLTSLPAGQPWHLQHLLKVEICLADGLPDDVINSTSNLAAFCEECNAGAQGLVDPVLWLTVMRRRLHSELF